MQKCDIIFYYISKIKGKTMEQATARVNPTTARVNPTAMVNPNPANATPPQATINRPKVQPQSTITEAVSQNISQLKVNVEKLDFAVTRKIRAYLKKLIDMGGSDLHVKAGSQIRARINGDIIIFSNEIFSKEDAITFAKELTRTRYPEFVQNKEMDMTYIYDESSRFRLNIFFQMDGVSFAFRTIPTIQNTIDRKSTRLNSSH